MRVPNSVLDELLQALPQLRPQIYFKSSLTALSHAMEDQVLAGSDSPLVIACFQTERFYRQEAHRYERIAELTNQLYILAAPETDFSNRSDGYETVAFRPSDPLSHEWHLVVIGQQYTSCLICREREGLTTKDNFKTETSIDMDTSRRFEGIWTFDRQVSCKMAAILLNRIAKYRPELKEKIKQARSQLLQQQPLECQSVAPDPFAQRLVNYLQAGQYKLLKAYAARSSQERKERLVNSITAAIRRTLNPQEILQVAAQELGQALGVCRCLIYRCQANDKVATIRHEFLGSAVVALTGKEWPLQTNPLFAEVVQRREQVYVQSAKNDPRFGKTQIAELIEQFQINSWLMVPVLYGGQIRGIVELHHCADCLPHWQADDLSLVEAIAAQVGVALIQGEAYANLEDLNQQLEALERTRSNLIAITGHELRTPLSTIQVCLESLATEPNMAPELQQVMLNTALADAERLRKLVQDFLTLSQLESGRVEWHLESLPLQECIDLALSNIRARHYDQKLPVIKTKLPPELPLVRADGEWLVEVLAKLLDNACKFTGSEGEVTLLAHLYNSQMLEVTIADTGRGITPDRLEAVFDRFYQEEGALRRSTGGTGLGLAICRQIVTSWGGQIWAKSVGKDQGSEFHFTIPIVTDSSLESSNPVNSNSAPIAIKRSARKLKAKNPE